VHVSVASSIRGLPHTEHAAAGGAFEKVHAAHGQLLISSRALGVTDVAIRCGK